MPNEDLINKQSTESEIAKLRQSVDELKEMMSYMLSAVVIRQKDACEIVGITQATARNMAKRGDLEPLQSDGGKANYLMLQTTMELKPRRKSKR